jgi:hypothetical protein
MINNNPFDFFDNIYCIHLPSNTERKDLIDGEFKTLGIGQRVQYVSADPPPKGFKMSHMNRSPQGEFGCNLSHIKAVVNAISVGSKTPLFFEDDVTFISDTLEIIADAIIQLPENWDVLYLGGLPRGPYTTHSSALVKISNFHYAEAYCIKGDYLYEYFSLWADRISKPNSAYDWTLDAFSKTHESFCTQPPVCEQRVGPSDISNKDEDRKTKIKECWKKWKQ